MWQVYATGSAELAKFQTFWIVLLVFRGSIVAAFAGCASQRHYYTILFAFARHFFSPQAWLAVNEDKR